MLSGDGCDELLTVLVLMAGWQLWFEMFGYENGHATLL